MAETLQLQGEGGIYFEAAAYNERHNLIIACPKDSSLQFYNADTLLPFEEIDAKKLENPALRMSYWPERETYLLGCLHGVIYAYDVSNKVLQKVQEQLQHHIVGLTFLNSRYYAFALLNSGCISVGNFDNRDVLNFNLGKNENSCWLSSLTKRNFLISSQTNGSVQIYRTDRLPRLPLIDTIRGFEDNTYFISRKIFGINLSGKEYILTVRADCTIQVWHLSKGKMKRLKVIHTGDRVFCMIYLEHYKILATTHNKQFIKFWRFPSGTLESRVDLDMQECRGIFLMKDKNCIGVSSIVESNIKIVNLHS